MSFVTDLTVLDRQDRQMRDQFVCRVSDDNLKKKLFEKGNTHTQIQAVSIGKAHETTDQEVQEPGPDHGPDHGLDHGPDHRLDHGPRHGSDHRRKKCFKEKKMLNRL